MYSKIIRPTSLEIDIIREEALKVSNKIFEPKLTKVWLNAIYGEIAKYIHSNFPIEKYNNTKYLLKYINFLNSDSLCFWQVRNVANGN